ncbi:MAG: hypothetical protein DI536_14240 [Archangium gephyra]|uniref:Uncharacterized protein n=1 Tax=Archangium gephyra TaxID=48 RepID=A0A2W5UU50_9BACT|nr:MAG: hypothetical protein DI536_14240 [Archangium gephyra]
MRFLLPLTLVLAGCALNDPFSSLPPGECSSDADCVVASCPNACHDGIPLCDYPLVRARVDVINACPCFGKPATGACVAPAPDACGLLPGCTAPNDQNSVQACCVAGSCTALRPDAGTP